MSGRRVRSMAVLGLLPLLLAAAPSQHRGLPLTQVQARKFRELSVRGKALADKGSFKAAADEFRMALLIRPDDATTYTNLGNVYYYGKNLVLAWDCYAMSLRLDPGQADMRKWLKQQKAALRSFAPRDGGVFLKWEAVPGAVGYLVYRKRGPGLPDLRLTETALKLPEFLARDMIPGDKGVFSLTQLRNVNGKPFEKPLGDIAGCAVPLSLYQDKLR